jgi:hypothetical protein
MFQMGLQEGQSGEAPCARPSTTPSTPRRGRLRAVLKLMLAGAEKRPLEPNKETPSKPDLSLEPTWFPTCRTKSFAGGSLRDYLAPQTGVVPLSCPKVPRALRRKRDAPTELRLRSLSRGGGHQGLTAAKRRPESASLSGWCRSGPMATAG